MQRAVLEVIGEAAPWCVTDRDAVAVLAGEAAEAVVFLRPPRASPPTAGPVSFAVKVAPRDSPEEGVVVAADVDVAAFHAITATIAPAVAAGFGRGRQTVTVRNEGNAPIPVEISADDPELLLDIDVAPATLLLSPGTAGQARVRARPFDASRDSSEARPYQVTVHPDEGPAIHLEGAVRLRAFPWALTGISAAVAVLLLLGVLLTRGRSTAPTTGAEASATTSLPAAPTSAGAGPTPSAGATTTVAAAGVATAGEAAAIAMGAECRPTADLKVTGRTLTNADRTFVREFADEGTAIAGRNLLTRHPRVCTIGNPSADDSVLTFHPPPADSALEIPGSRCSARYAPAGLTKSKTPDNAKFVVEVGPKQFLFYLTEADRDRAFVLLQGHNQICWLGGGAEDIFGTFFNWSRALTYF